MDTTHIEFALVDTDAIDERGTISKDLTVQIESHPLVRFLRSDPAWVETFAHLALPAHLQPTHFLNTTLHSPESIPIRPVQFLKKQEALPSLVCITYLGRKLCGYTHIVHGGLLATLMDDALARVCFPLFPSTVGVTASLTIDYLRPCPSERFVLIRAEATRVSGKHVCVRGWMEVLDGQDSRWVAGRGGPRLLEAEALMVEPPMPENMLA